MMLQVSNLNRGTGTLSPVYTCDGVKCHLANAAAFAEATWHTARPLINFYNPVTVSRALKCEL